MTTTAAAAGGTTTTTPPPPAGEGKTTETAKGAAAATDAGKSASTAPADKAGTATTTDGGSLITGSGESKDSEAASGELELTLPEGVDAKLVLMDELKPLAKEAGLKGEVAQKFADLMVKSHAAAAQQAREGFVAQTRQWVETVKADKEYGGSNFEASQQLVQKAFRQFATPALKELLLDSGLGNHPELFRLMAKVGKAIGEDSVGDTGGTSASGAKQDNSREAKMKRMFPSSYKTNDQKE
jgi:hypothetical protein